MSSAEEPEDARAERRSHSARRIPEEALDQDALRVVSRLNRAGFEAYLVGGCVRDLMLGRKPKDFDIATAAHPRQVKRLFRNGRIIGRRFRLVHITYGDHVIEVSTFRREPPPRPEGEEDPDLLIVEDNVFGTAEEDARRRDFTINALFLDPTRRRIQDHVGGMQDLEAGVLRTIGDPAVRMAEDPVRILRAIKFATRLGFRIDDATWAAMEESSSDLARSARPRVLEEILRLLRSGTSLGAFRMLRACGALAVILPQIDEHLGRRDDPDPAAHDRADQFWRLLEALDADVHAGNVPTTAVSVAALFLRMIEREADPATRTLPGPAKDLGQAAAEILEPFALTARLSRRDCGLARRIVVLQRRFTQTGGKRFRPMQFAASEDFPLALDLFRLRSMAWGQGWDVYEAWLERRRRALAGPEAEGEVDGEAVAEVAPEGEAGDAPRRRGRRRGRRRRRSSAS